MKQQVPEAGTLLAGKFRVIRLLGQGGMGVVLEAENTATKKRVAVKWLHPDFAASEEGAKRMMQEAQASARFSHPNVVDVYDVVHEADSFFIVMEMLEGEPLTAAMRRGDLPLHILLELLVHAMRGVAAAHRHGVIHRDIKPDNIFLARETDRAQAVPKVLDFGISKVQGSESLGLTRTGTTMGTPMYMSYEQLCNSKDIDGRTDVYSFGVILYEALTGVPPFEAETFPALAIKIATAEPASLKGLRPEIPSTLERVVLRALAKNRDERIPSLDALINELTPFTTEAGFRGQMTIAMQATHASGAPSGLLQSTPQQPSPPSSPSFAAQAYAPVPVSAPSAVNPPASRPPASAVAGSLDTMGRLSVPAARSEFELSQLPQAWPHARLAIGAGCAALLMLVLGLWLSSSSDKQSAEAPVPAPVPAAPSAPALPALAATPGEPTPPQAARPVKLPAGADMPDEKTQDTHRARTAASASRSRDTPAPERASSLPVPVPARSSAPSPVSPTPVVAPEAPRKTGSEAGYRAGRPRASDF